MSTLQASLWQTSRPARKISSSSLSGGKTCAASRARMLTVSDSSTQMQDFPYNMDPSIEHHNLWNPTPLSSQQLEQVQQAASTGGC